MKNGFMVKSFMVDKDMVFLMHICHGWFFGWLSGVYGRPLVQLLI